MAVGINIATLDAELKAMMKGVTRQVLKAQKDQVRRVYHSIIDDSPIYTGYYASNHRIIIRSSKGQFTAGGRVELSPGTKPEGAREFSLESNIGVAIVKELGKLGRLKLGDTVLITTRVPYADDVERNHGVYAGAQAKFGAR